MCKRFCRGKKTDLVREVRLWQKQSKAGRQPLGALAKRLVHSSLLYFASALTAHCHRLFWLRCHFFVKNEETFKSGDAEHSDDQVRFLPTYMGRPAAGR
jgi:hypothetical protein